MTIFGLLSFSQQGVYDAIHNLGSLVARFFFHVSYPTPLGASKRAEPHRAALSSCSLL